MLAVYGDSTLLSSRVGATIDYEYKTRLTAADRNDVADCRSDLLFNSASLCAACVTTASAGTYANVITRVSPPVSTLTIEPVDL